MYDKIYEIGIIIRGFTLTNCNFKSLSNKNFSEENKDLRASFISAINSIAEVAFYNNSLEYLQSGNILFIFKMDNIKTIDKEEHEPIILYGITKKTKKNPDKFVKKFLEKVTPILEHFKIKYQNKDFSHVSLFKPFSEEIKKYFINE